MPAFKQLRTVRRQQHLVGGHDRCALLDRRCTHSCAGVDTADDFDDDVGRGREDVVEAVGPVDGRRDPVGALARHITIEDVRQLEAIGQFRTLDQNPRDRRADGAESEQRDLERRLLARGSGLSRS